MSRTTTSTSMAEISLDLTAAGPSEFLAPDRLASHSPTGLQQDPSDIAPWDEPVRMPPLRTRTRD
jgi:hypothetical protein